MAVTFQGTYTKDKGMVAGAGTVAITPDGGSTTTETLDGAGSYSVSIAGTSFKIVETITGDPKGVVTKTVKVLDGSTVDTSRDIGRVGSPGAESPGTATSAQCATAAATDLTTAEALANALKADYNAAQVDVAAVITALNALLDALQAAGLMS